MFHANCWGLPYAAGMPARTGFARSLGRVARSATLSRDLAASHGEVAAGVARRLGLGVSRDAAQAAGRPISLHIEAQDHPTVQGSPAQLRELLTNLIFNAVDALPARGTIRLRVAAEGGQATIEVSDSGVGMSPEVQERVFEPLLYHQRREGTGLGLAMVFRIVEQHDGRIEVRSTPGEGTSFRVVLPLADVSANAWPTTSDVAQLEPRSASRWL